MPQCAMHRRVGRSGTQWMIAETEYLLRIANHRLILARYRYRTRRLGWPTSACAIRGPGWTRVRMEQIARGENSPHWAASRRRTVPAWRRRLDPDRQIPQLKIDRATIGTNAPCPSAPTRRPASEQLGHPAG